MKVHSCRLLLVLVPMLLGFGCNIGAYDPELGTVQGRVMFDGLPLGEAIVTFIPSDGPPSGAITDVTGRYELRFKNGEPGALPGVHTVMISGDLEGSGGENESVPTKYNEETTLTATVKLGENTIDFDLKP